MQNNKVRATMADPVFKPFGSLQVGVYDENIGMPVDNAIIKIINRETGKTIEQLFTNSSGQTVSVNLDTPPVDYSLLPNQPKPYSEYDVQVEVDGFVSQLIEGVQILPTQRAIQVINLEPKDKIIEPETDTIILPHSLWYQFPPKIPESAVKELPQDTGFVVLDKPVIPEFIVVHDGAPTDATAKNYTVKFKDYIKTVACGEIYSTWTTEAIKANILAILSFTLNRVFTEWYRNKGYNFTITASPAYDQIYSHQRNIFEEISIIVDGIFTNYITKEGIRQPLFTQYCDGIKTTCPDRLSQWGSEGLGKQGYVAINILKYYYGSDIFLKEATKVSGIPKSFSGTNLQVGSRGADVKTIQEQLNSISVNYPAIKKLKVDGIYGPATKNEVITFQQTFKLPPTGIVDFATWYKISDIYVAVNKFSS